MQFSMPKVSIDESCFSFDWPPRTTRPGAGGGSKESPGVGGAEKLKPQDAIPPFSLIVASIHGKKKKTLVKTEYSWLVHFSPIILLTIPTSRWLVFSLTTVSGPPLSPWHGPAVALPAHTIRLSFAVAFIFARQLLLSTIGTSATWSTLVEV